MNQLACSLIVPTHNAPSDICALLKSLKGQLRQSDEVIIVDDGSAKAHRDKLKQIVHEANMPQVTLVLKNHTGLGGTWNVAVKKSTNPFLLFINDDSVADPQWLESMRKSLTTADAVQGNYWTQAIVSKLDRQHMLWREVVGRAKRQDHPGHFGVHTRNFGIRRDVLYATCGQVPFPKRQHPNASEDILLGQQLLKHGVKIALNEEAIITDIGDEHTWKTVIKKKYAHGKNDSLVDMLSPDTFTYSNFRRTVIEPVKAGVHIYVALILWFSYVLGAANGARLRK